MAKRLVEGEIVYLEGTRYKVTGGSLEYAPDKRDPASREMEYARGQRICDMSDEHLTQAIEYQQDRIKGLHRTIEVRRELAETQRAERDQTLRSIVELSEDKEYRKILRNTLQLERNMRRLKECVKPVNIGGNGAKPGASLTPGGDIIYPPTHEEER